MFCLLLQLVVELTKFEGTLMMWMPPPPSNRLWISFLTPPEVSFIRLDSMLGCYLSSQHSMVASITVHPCCSLVEHCTVHMWTEPYHVAFNRYAGNARCTVVHCAG